MRRYLQGTLDFHCAIYALINALVCLRRLDFFAARHIFEESVLEIAAQPELFRAFTRNETDHYWVVRYLLGRWCTTGLWQLEATQPFGSCLLGAGTHLPPAQEIALHIVGPAPASPSSEHTWEHLQNWLNPTDSNKAQVALFRFHRYLPPRTEPLVLHWTCGITLKNNILQLHDASAELQALHSITYSDTLPRGEVPQVRIEPESILLLR